MIDRGTVFVALKAFRMSGEEYSPGKPVDISKLADHKVSQLLNQRYIRPSAPPDTDA